MSLKTAKPFENTIFKKTTLMIDDLKTNFHAGSHFFSTGSSSARGNGFFPAVTGWLVDLGKKWPKRATNLKKQG